MARRVGGLADTVVDATPVALADGVATGFVFGPATAVALSGAVERAVRLYRQGAPWRVVMQRAMAQDFSWDHAAREYIALYDDVMGRPSD